MALVTTAGIVAGATTSLCPDLPLLRLYITVMLVPVVIAVGLLDSLYGFGLATKTAVPAAQAPLPTPIFSTFADDEDIAPLLPSFCANLRTYLHELAGAVAREDRKAIARLAHQLIGAGGSYGFDAITSAARQLEADLRAQPTDIAPAVAALVRVCDAVLAAHGRVSEQDAARPH